MQPIAVTLSTIPTAIAFDGVHDTMVTLGGMDPVGEIYHTLLYSLLSDMGIDRLSISNCGPIDAYGFGGQPI